MKKLKCKVTIIKLIYKQRIDYLKKKRIYHWLSFEKKTLFWIIKL